MCVWVSLLGRYLSSSFPCVGHAVAELRNHLIVESAPTGERSLRQTSTKGVCRVASRVVRRVWTDGYSRSGRPWPSLGRRSAFPVPTERCEEAPRGVARLPHVSHATATTAPWRSRAGVSAHLPEPRWLGGVCFCAQGGEEGGRPRPIAQHVCATVGHRFCICEDVANNGSPQSNWIEDARRTSQGVSVGRSCGNCAM